jgi:hypothetical protein
MTIHSYGKVWSFGHKEASTLVGMKVRVEEKIDGSQFSAMKDKDGNLHFRSKSVMMVDGAIPWLFQPSVDHIRGQAAFMVPGTVYRFEAMRAARHNTLQYSRAPKGHCVLFDVDRGDQDYCDRSKLVAVADALDVDPVPQLDECVLESPDDLTRHLEATSFLGGALVEGVVVKPLVNVYTPDGKRIAAKLVSEAFKETHSKAWIPDKEGKAVIERRIADAIGTPARFAKAVQRLRERDEWTGTVKDIGGLIGEVAKDLDEECKGVIEQMLYDEYRKTVVRLVTSRVPYWYKKELLGEAFQESEGT